MRSHDVKPGANLDGARGDSVASLGVAGTRCRMDRDRAATRRFSHDRTAIHARHGYRLAIALGSRSGSKGLRVILVSRCNGQRLRATGAAGRKSRGLGRSLE